MPFDNALCLQANEGGGPDLGLVEVAIAGFDLRHPYLLFNQSVTNRLRKRVTDHPKLLARLKRCLSDSNSVPTEYELRRKIKHQARRLILTSFLALVGHRNAREEALHATRVTLSAFTRAKSWKVRPAIKSFLDCAEIALAVSLTYDWLYDEFTAEEREVIERSLLQQVLEPALVAYDDRFTLWPKRRDNCALVSNSGILIAALAMLKRRPDTAAHLIRQSLSSSWRIFEALAPDGAWPEGPSYWSLAMRYAALMIAALESAFGHSFGLVDRPGLALTGDFALHAVGPFGAAFNFGDSESRLDVSPLVWFAHRFKRPIDAHLIGAYEGWFLPFTAIWANRPKGSRRKVEPPTAKIFYSGNLACFRSTWSKDPGARPVYLAIKGGCFCWAGRVGLAPGGFDPTCPGGRRQLYR